MKSVLWSQLEMRLDEQLPRWMTLIGPRIKKKFVGIDLLVDEIDVFPIRRLIVIVVDVIVMAENDVGIGMIEVGNRKIVGNFVYVQKATSAHLALIRNKNVGR